MLCVIINCVYTDGDDIRITVHPGDVTCRYNEEVVLQCTAISMSGTPLDCQWMIGMFIYEHYMTVK